MEDQLKKALKLAKRTGDRVIMVDSADPRNSAFVVMNIDEYEKMLSYKEGYKEDVKGLTEEQLIDKINRDIALWKEEEQEEEIEDIFPAEEGEEDMIEEESMYYYPGIMEDHPEIFSEQEEEEVPPEEEPEEKKETPFEEEEEENIFEKFARQQQELGQEEQEEEGKKNDWKIPFDVKEGAAEVQEDRLEKQQ